MPTLELSGGYAAQDAAPAAGAQAKPAAPVYPEEDEGAV